uniref:BCAS3 WD40 domain-containing protein n=1 Tax=Timema shepardi TaxID=629360 RepID=A0A7R9G308_TIMSH|nr:unnamed protein product [Timema shepardi]
MFRITSPSSQREDQRSGDYSGPVSDVIAHFVAHSEPILALAFDPSGMLLLTADKRGHDFHLFRIQPHPGGPSLAAVHHLYTLHRGDTTAKVQDIAFAADSRWVAVSTMRGTTHVFPITPYGGTVGVRTHATPHVVNRLSRFHRSAGLTTDGRNSPIPYAASSGNYETVALSPAMPYPNPRLPPYPHPTVVLPLAQIRQPFSHSLLSTSTSTSPNLVSQQAYHRNPSVRVLGRTQSSSDDGLPGGSVPLQMTTCFAPPRAWLVGSPTVPRDSSAKAHKRVVDSLFVMTCHGSLIEYDLEPKHASGVAKEKICDDTSIELEVHAKAQWLLLRQSTELPPPLPASNPLMALPDRLLPVTDTRQHSCDERWLSQVEIVTHAGPHRRLWMGPQFTFKTYTTSSGAPLSLLEMETVDVGVGHGSRPARSNPVNMPLSAGTRPIVPVLIESGSSSSYEQSPTLLEYKGDGGDSDGSTGPVESQLKEDLADAMMESPGITTRDTAPPVPVQDLVDISNQEEQDLDEDQVHSRTKRRRVIVELRGELLTKRSSFPIEKVVNPLGTVITISMPFDDNESCHQTMHGVVYSPQHLKRTDQKVLSTEENILEGGVRWPTDVKSSDVAVTGEKTNVELERDSKSVLTPSQDACSDQVNFTDMQPPVNVPLDAFENAGAAAFNLEPEIIVIATEEEEENNVIGGGGCQSMASCEDLSSSSFSSASRASFEARCSPSLLHGTENVLVFPGDSSGSV